MLPGKSYGAFLAEQYSQNCGCYVKATAFTSPSHNSLGPLNHIPSLPSPKKRKSCRTQPLYSVKVLCTPLCGARWANAPPPHLRGISSPLLGCACTSRHIPWSSTREKVWGRGGYALTSTNAALEFTVRLMSRSRILLPTRTLPADGDIL